MKVLGIDPGTVVTGYGIVDGSGAGGTKKLVCLCEGTIRTTPKAPLAVRLLEISSAIDKVIEEYAPDCASVESVFYAKNVKSAITLGHARGVVLTSAARGGLSVYEHSPSTLKQSVVGYGNATKEQVQKMVKTLLNMSTTPKADAADALAAAICHINHSSFIKAAGKAARAI